jgi:formylglycine-generating enzyme required for sulfatase activity
MTPEQSGDLQRAWAEYLGRPVAVTNGIGMRLALIPPGRFPGYPRFPALAEIVLTRPYDLGVTEVTRGQFRRYIEATHFRTQAELDDLGGTLFLEPGRTVRDRRYTWRDPFPGATDDHPVVQVSWYDAVAFCEWLSKQEGRTYRLPTLAEWCWACRAGTAGELYFGDDRTRLGEYEWFLDNAGKRPQPVGLKKPNPWGLYDLLGNVSEWARDGSGSWPKGVVADPVIAEGSPTRLTPGHNYLTADDPSGGRPISCDRNSSAIPGFTGSTIGFRVLREH